jgi:ABC-type transport system involved in multi-copper enzyme maturation permease subunit
MEKNSRNNWIIQLKVLLVNDLKRNFITKKSIIIICVYTLFFILSAKLGSVLEMLSFLMPDIRIDFPYQLVLAFFSGMILMPLFSLLLSYDSVSSDYSNKSLMLVGYRTPRGIILLSKLLSGLILLAIINLIVYAFFGIYLSIRYGYDAISSFSILMVLLFIYSFLFYSIGFFSSVAFKSPTKSFWNGILINTVIFILPLAYNMPLTKYFSPYFFSFSSVRVFSLGFHQIYMIYLIAGIVLLWISKEIFYKRDIS